MEKDKVTILKRGELTYYIYSKKVLVKIDDRQYVSYNPYWENNRAGLPAFIEEIVHSEPYEYGTPADLVSLATVCGIRGASTERRPECE